MIFTILVWLLFISVVSALVGGAMTVFAIGLIALIELAAKIGLIKR